MSKILSFGLICVAILAAGTANAQNVLQGDLQLPANSNESERATDLFQGDLGAEIGIGCSNGSGTSGGPNDVAVSVTSPLATPFHISAHYYNIFTNVSPTITALTFSVWGGGATPGAIVGQQAGMDFAVGYHTAPVAPAICVESAQFFFGQTQPQSTAALRWGLDTSSGGGTTSFILAPGCGLSAWGTMTSIGFAGNWVMSVSVEDGCGVDPVELTSWGEIKTVWQ